MLTRKSSDLLDLAGNFPWQISRVLTWTGWFFSVSTCLFLYFFKNGSKSSSRVDTAMVSVMNLMWISLRSGICSSDLHDGPRLSARTSHSMPLLEEKYCRQAAFIQLNVNSSKGYGTNSYPAVFLSFSINVAAQLLHNQFPSVVQFLLTTAWLLLGLVYWLGHSLCLHITLELVPLVVEVCHSSTRFCRGITSWRTRNINGVNSFAMHYGIPWQL